MTTDPQCFDCRHLDATRNARGELACAAFPAGIPQRILLNKHDHAKPYPGDKGIRFEPKPTADLPTS